MSISCVKVVIIVEVATRQLELFAVGCNAVSGRSWALLTLATKLTVAKTGDEVDSTLWPICRRHFWFCCGFVDCCRLVRLCQPCHGRHCRQSSTCSTRLTLSKVVNFRHRNVRRPGFIGHCITYVTATHCSNPHITHIYVVNTTNISLFELFNQLFLAWQSQH